MKSKLNRSPEAAVRPPLCAVIVASIAVASFAFEPAIGAVIENTNDFVGKAKAKSPDDKYTSQLDFKDVLPLAGPTKEELMLLTKNYNKPSGPKWTFEPGGAAPGKFRIMEHQAFARNTVYGADLSVLYDDGIKESKDNWSWVQIISGDNWRKKGPYTDNDSAFNNTPFYSNYTPNRLRNQLKTPSSYFNLDSIWLNSDYPSQTVLNPAGGGKVPAGDLIFVDEPYVNDATFASYKAGYCHISFHLYLVSYTFNGKDGNDAKGNITVYDGMSWGVTVVPAPAPVTLLVLAAGPCLARRRRQRRNDLSVRPNC